MEELTTEKRWRIMQLSDMGYGPRAIERELKIPHQTASFAIRRHQEMGSVDDRPRSGRPPKLNPSAKKRIVELTRGKRRLSTRKVAREAKKRQIADVSHETIRKTLHESDLKPFHRKKISRLLPQQRTKRKAFAIANEDKDWTKTVFSDEKKFILFDAQSSQRHCLVRSP